MGPPIIRDTTQNDSISVIYFGNNGYFVGGSATVMQTAPWYLCRNSSDSVAFKDDSDTKIKRVQYIDLSYPGFYWSYDTTTNILPSNAIPFYDIILHELGHAHGLGHINDLNSIMYWLTRTGHERLGIDSGSTFPGPGSLLGGWDMVNTSATYSPSYCMDNILIPSSRTCPDATAGVPLILENPYNLTLYPNPDDEETITLSYQLIFNSNLQFKITDCTGRILLIKSEENRRAGDYKEQINIGGLAQGVYLFTANINGELQTIKFIKL